MRKKIAILALLVAVGGGATLAALGGISLKDMLGMGGKESQLRSRVEDYWRARTESDLEKQVAYLHPLQEAIPEPGMMVTEKASVLDLRIDGDEAFASVEMTVRLRHPVLGRKSRDVTIDDHWVKYQGDWYKDVMPIGLNQTIQNLQGTWENPAEQKADIAPGAAEAPVSQNVQEQD